MSSGSVGNGELTKVVTNHLGLDFNKTELLTVVNTKNGTDHLRDNDHVSEVGLDSSGLLVGASSLLSSTELLDETHGSLVKTTVQSSASTSMDDLAEFRNVEVEELREVNTTVAELLKSSLLTFYFKRALAKHVQQNFHLAFKNHSNIQRIQQQSYKGVTYDLTSIL